MLIAILVQQFCVCYVLHQGGHDRRFKGGSLHCTFCVAMFHFWSNRAFESPGDQVGHKKTAAEEVTIIQPDISYTSVIQARQRAVSNLCVGIYSNNPSCGVHPDSPSNSLLPDECV